MACALLLGCSTGAERTPSDLTSRGNALGVGSCADSCGTLADSGECWCDSICALLGDCCADVDDICELDECSLDGDGDAVGCADGEACVQEDDGPASCELLEQVVARCENDEHIATATEDDDGDLTLRVEDLDGDLLFEGAANMRTIEDGPRITRIGIKSGDTDLRIRTRDTKIPATEGTAHLRFDKKNRLMECDTY